MSLHQKEILQLDDMSELEWLYLPDILYAEYDTCKRYMQLIVPYKPVWKDEKYPVIVFVPGSAWYKQDMYSNIPILGHLAERGYAIAAVQFRESTIAPFPAQAQDAKAAIRFLRSKAEEFHLDAENIFIMGGSSGAHIALLAGLTQSTGELDSDLYPEYSCSVNGIIDFSAPVDLLICREESSTDNGPSDDLLGGINIRSVPELAKKASCITYINKSLPIPPVLIFHGTEDGTVSHHQSEILYDKLVQEGKKVTFYSVKGAKHGGAVFWRREIINIIDGFIQEHLKN